MADGILCKHCGHQETEHDMVGKKSKHAGKKLRGRKKSLRNCPSYHPEDEELAAEFDRENREKQARQFRQYRDD